VSGVPPVGARSWWLDDALRVDPGTACPPLAGETAADVCVAGGGFAGLWTAYELTERVPSLDVVIVEADICGAGGSGANGGFFSPSWTSLEVLCTVFGEEGGVRYATALADETAALGEWVARHAARIDFHHEGILFAAAGEWQARAGDETFRILARHGLEGRLVRVDAAAARRVADSPRFVGGLMTPDLATVQPAKLARELRRVLLERGVRIYEGTPMTGIEPGAPLRVRTPAGAVAARDVVVTTGAWAVREPHFRCAFGVCVDFMIVTEPIPESLEDIGWHTHTGIADSRELAYYLRRTDDDRIAIGGGAIGAAYGGLMSRRALTSPRLATVAAEGLAWLFPALAGVRIDAAWSGPMDMTPAGVPFFESSCDGHLHAGLGFSGHGLAATRVGGRTLASLVLHEDDEWSRLPVVGPPLMRVPPEPVRFPLVAAVAWAHESGDRARDAGRHPGVLRSVLVRGYDTYATLARRGADTAPPGP
jgi:glycine/D-amino acid oxidase-like deaminating enzyme